MLSPRRRTIRISDIRYRSKMPAFAFMPRKSKFTGHGN